MNGGSVLWRHYRQPSLPLRNHGANVAQGDISLLLAVAALLAIGLLMVGSASISIADRQVGAPFHYLLRQGAYVGVGIVLAIMTVQIPLAVWQRLGPVLLLLSLALLLLVLIPGVGRNVNGATRWISLGIFSLQVSEVAKLALVVYTAGYLVRRGEEVRTSVRGFLKPLGVLVVFAVLLLAQPDFGALVVLGSTLLGMLFLAGVRLWMFGLLVAGAVGTLALLAITSPYRMERLTTFMNPWADPFNSGFQLTQALIAFGRGDWFGVGLGGSVQKLFYLPEAHTDFLFAVLAEELGLFGALTVILLFVFVVWRAFAIGRTAAGLGAPYAAYLAYGIGLLIAVQACINLGVNMGVLPTKGLTLPLMSYGGSSMLITCCAIGLLLRVDRENRRRGQGV
ncbi:MAG: putative lipid II flippase FtsW [Thiohalomonadaceae bacterium]